MKIEKKEINKRTLVIGGIALAVVLIAAIMIAEGVSGMKKKKTDVSEGLKIIEQAESADVTAIETKIGQLEAKDSQGQEDTRSLKEIFGSTVVMGDSISEGFAEFDVLNTSSVISKIGVELDELDEQVEQLVKVNPQVVFLTFGANDILATKGDEKAYIEQYKALIEKIRKKLPDAVCGLGSLNTRNEYGELNIEKEARMLAVSFAGYDSEKGKDDIVYVAVNPYWEDTRIFLPDLQGRETWYLCVNTYGDGAGRYVYPEGEEVRIESEFVMKPRSVAVFTTKSY